MSNQTILSSESALQIANSLFVDENFELALKHYNEAIQLDQKNFESFIKRSTCYFKLERFTESLEDANEAIKLQPNNSKGYLRKGMALFSLEEFETAKIVFEKGQSLDPSNSQFKIWIRKCVAELEIESPVTSSQPKIAENKSITEENLSKPTKNEVSQDFTQQVKNETNVKSETNVKVEPKFRHEFYQTSTHVIVTIFAKNISKEQTNIELGEKSMCVTISLSDSNQFILDLDLFEKIIPSESSTMFLSTKIEIKLKKANSARWNTLESTTVSKPAVQPSINSKKNWDKIVEEVAKVEPLDVEDPLNKVFQDIYSNGSDEQKRAMLKSFQESGGTVLSTNWDEVGKGPVKGSPPEGLEMHRWDELTKV